MVGMKKILLPLSMVLFVVLVAEVGFWLEFRLSPRYHTSPAKFSKLDGTPLAPSDVNEFRSESFRSKRYRDDGSKIYDEVTNLLPSTARFSTNPVKANNFLLFVGCSFTYGLGVNDTQTLPSQMTTHLPDYVSYNFAIPGTHPGTMIDRLTKVDAQEIKEPTGWVVHGYIENQMERLVGAFHYLGVWGSYRPYYEIKDGKLHSPGTWRELFPWKMRLWELVMKSNTVRFLVRYWRPAATDEDWDKLMEMFQALQKISQEKYHAKGLIVLLWPRTTDKERMKKRLAAINIRTLELDPEKFSPIPYDGHPSAETYALYAKDLANYIQTISSESAPAHPSR